MRIEVGRLSDWWWWIVYVYVVVVVRGGGLENIFLIPLLFFLKINLYNISKNQNYPTISEVKLLINFFPLILFLISILLEIWSGVLLLFIGLE